jgi:hypothetical protein
MTKSVMTTLVYAALKYNSENRNKIRMTLREAKHGNGVDIPLLRPLPEKNRKILDY